MNNRRFPNYALVLLWLPIAWAYVWAAREQKAQLNLSATAGGQMPYLVYAQRVAEDGLLGHFGDRNRMPLIPILTSLVYDPDWDTFVERASWAAVLSSMLVLVGVGAVAYCSLSVAEATAFTLIVAAAVFLPQASFVQADLAYYGLFFCMWWMMARLVHEPGVGRALAVGALLGVTYLTKASALLALPILLAVLAVKSAVSAWARRRRMGGTPSILRPLIAGAVVTAVFSACTSPYLLNNHARFGRFFYNVNTTFFVWCDNWRQAKGFMDEYQIDRRYPQAPAEAVPGPFNYWKTHAPRQIAQRLAYGCWTLGKLAWEGPYAKYVVLLLLGCLALSVTRRAEAIRVWHEHRWPILLTTAMLAGYFLAYAWYVVVAYGDRFVASLLLPAMFATFLLIDKLAAPRLVQWFGAALIVLVLGEGWLSASSTPVRPSPTFVAFYYDESREEFVRGNHRDAQRGFRGVIRLDPSFAPAHRDLGMIALGRGDFDAAIAALSEAARLQPDWADVQNSLGSALIQAGRPREAVPVLRRATQLDPDFAVAWYNLGGAHVMLGEVDDAEAIRVRLLSISPEHARQLGTLIHPAPATPAP